MQHELGRRWLAGTAIMALLLAALACNLPGAGTAQVAEEGTEVTATEAATFFIDPTLLTPAPTEEEPVETATATPEQEEIPSPTGCGYWAEFVEDVTVPDGTAIVAGDEFTKTWRFRNNGCLDWPDGTQMIYWGGDQMGGPDAVDVPATAFNKTADVSINLTAPTEPGEYTGYWQIVAPDGAGVGAYVYVAIEVIAPTATPTATATEEADPADTFIGTWDNPSDEDGSIARVEINVDDDSILVQRWDTCDDDLCDRGVSSTDVEDAEDNILSLVWTGAEESGEDVYKAETQQLAILLDGRLQISGQVDLEDEDEDDFSYTVYLVKDE